MNLGGQLIAHDPGPGCDGMHCYIHDVDEVPYGAYLVCAECGHVYRTARDLRRAYRRQLRDVLGWRRPWIVRASTIYFCPECAHDF